MRIIANNPIGVLPVVISQYRLGLCAAITELNRMLFLLFFLEL